MNRCLLGSQGQRERISDFVSSAASREKAWGVWQHVGNGSEHIEEMKRRRGGKKKTKLKRQS